MYKIKGERKMRNDIKKIDNITNEMEVNNQLYYDMIREFYDCIGVYYCHIDNDALTVDFQILLFK